MFHAFRVFGIFKGSSFFLSFFFPTLRIVFFPFCEIDIAMTFPETETETNLSLAKKCRHDRENRIDRRIEKETPVPVLTSSFIEKIIRRIVHLIYISLHEGNQEICQKKY